MVVNRFYPLSTQSQQRDDRVFALLVDIQTVLLQLKVIPHDSAYAWPSSSLVYSSTHVDLVKTKIEQSDVGS